MNRNAQIRLIVAAHALERVLRDPSPVPGRIEDARATLRYEIDAARRALDMQRRREALRPPQ